MALLWDNPWLRPRDTAVAANPSSRATIEKAVKQMQLYLGSVDYASFKDQQRLRKKLDRTLEKIAREHRASVDAVPGQHYEENPEPVVVSVHQVLAGAYRGRGRRGSWGNLEGRTMLTHAVVVDAEGRWIEQKSVCRRGRGNHSVRRHGIARDPADLPDLPRARAEARLRVLR